MERNNLHWLYNANLDFCEEISRVNKVENLADVGSLGGAVFKSKLLSPQRLYALGSIGTALAGYSYLLPLTLMLGPTIPHIGIASLLFFGLYQSNERNYINAIEVIKEGEKAGNLKLTINKSPFVTTTIIANPKNINAVVSLGNDDLGAEDCEPQVVEVSEYETASGELVSDLVRGCRRALPG